jgi:hypothetical protein
MEGIISPNVFGKDAKGHLVSPGNVRESDRLTDEAVWKLCTDTLHFNIAESDTTTRCGKQRQR